MFETSAFFTTNTATNDHLKFDTVLFKTSGSTLALDTTSPYITGPGASVGRITLPANRKFFLRYLLQDFTGTGLITDQSFFITWYNATSGSPLGYVHTNTLVDRSLYFSSASIVVGASPIVVEARITYSKQIIGYKAFGEVEEFT